MERKAINKHYDLDFGTVDFEHFFLTALEKHRKPPALDQPVSVKCQMHKGEWRHVCFPILADGELDFSI